MHRLHRATAPDCLQNYAHGVNAWCNQSPTYVERQVIWAAINSMQNSCCAYCEAQLTEPDRHIEHFRQRSHYPAGTFDWSNLFGSCNRLSSCGKHKDNCGHYNHVDLIKPDIEDPDDFFVFVSDGTIAIRSGLNPAAAHRAAETLRILNINEKHGPLRYMRYQAAVGYLQTADTFRELAAECDENEWRPLLEDELQRIATLPFSTVIRHTLLGNAP